MANLFDAGVVDNYGLTYHPKQKHLWRVAFEGIEGLTTEDLKSIQFQAVSCTRPSITYEEQEMLRMNSRIRYLGRPDFEPVNISFEDDVSSQVIRVIRHMNDRQLLHLSGSAPGWPGASTAAKYKFTTRLELFTADLQPIERWILKGCMITSFDATDLDQGDTSAVRINLTVRYDTPNLYLPGEDGLQGPDTPLAY